MCLHRVGELTKDLFSSCGIQPREISTEQLRIEELGLSSVLFVVRAYLGLSLGI
jgi:hypothetical protein